MTAFATCAYVGCSKRIPYEPNKDAVRRRYCDNHMYHIASRGGWKEDDQDNVALWIRVVQKPQAGVRDPELRYILLCPVCKSRVVVAASKFSPYLPCVNAPECSGKMIYHKDVV